MSLGPVMLDVTGTELSEDDRKRLLHPQTGGVILFSRNYQNPQQLSELVREIHALRRPRLIVAADQEGGRVQRFREGFQRLPAMGQLGEFYEQNSDHALGFARTVGWLAAAELLVYGVDLSFSPVLDLRHSISSVIGDRAFHHHPETVVHLANAFISGMREAGMEAVGKHFPGHGTVHGDSHHELPFDQRSFSTMEQTDLKPFRQVINTHLAAVMMAHVVYESVDTLPACFSRFWIETVLRQRLQFEGTVFSDDLSMAGAQSMGSYVERARQALQAGCDMILVCNDSDAADEVLESLKGYNNPVSQLRLVRMHGHPHYTSSNSLYRSRQWRQSVNAVQQFISDAPFTEAQDLFLPEEQLR